MPVNVNENTSPQEIQVLNNGERADVFRGNINMNFKVLKDLLDAHIDDSINTETGAHGLRWYNDVLQFFNGTDWVEIETGGGGVPPSNVINPSIQTGNLSFTIKWTDPNDIVVNGQTISTWAGTKLVRKVGSFPTNEKDGILLVDNEVRGAYASTGFVDSGLTDGATYYYQLFPYNDLGAVNRNTVNRLSATASSVPPSNVINPSIQTGNLSFTIKWTDPNDTVVDGQTISWAGTKLVRKAGSYPVDERDGVVLVDNKVRSAYASTGFVDSGLTSGTTYYYQLFPYSDQGAVNRDVANRLSGTAQVFKIFGVRIDLTNSNPETAVTYTDGAVGMTAGSSAWDSMPIFKDIKPCVLKNGVVQYYLDPNDFTKKADGTAADITSGNAGDVMIEIPKTGFSITTNGNYIDVKVTDNPNNAAFKYYAHSRAAEGDRQKLYIGAYKGYNLSSKLRSLSGKATTVSQTIGTFRTQARANGSGYDLFSFYPMTLIQCLYLIKYKNLDSQTALGQGYVNGSAATNTGATNTAGMCYGSTSTTSRVKLFGIEDLWGNAFDWIDGLYIDANRNILTAFQNFNDTGSGYTNRGQGATANLNGYMSKPQGTTEGGFIPKEASGSSTTYFADNTYLNASGLLNFGGGWGSGVGAGVFRIDANSSATYTGTGLGARLMYL